MALSSIASKVSGSTPSAMCRSSESWRLKSKGEPGRFEEGEAGAVVHLEEGMERPTFVYFESTDHPQTEEIFVKKARVSLESRQR